MIAPLGLRLRGAMSMWTLPMVQALVARGHEVEMFLVRWSNPEGSGRREERGGVGIHNITLASSTATPTS